MPTDNTVYEEYSDPYDKILLNWSRYLELKDLHLSFLSGSRRILDFGTGTGNQAAALIGANKEVHAIDINLHMIHSLRQKVPTKNKKNLTLYIMNVEATAFADDYFDGVTAMNVIYNVPNPLQAMGEAFRVTQPGGIFLMSGPKAESDVDYLVKELIKEMRQKGLYDQQVKEDIKVIHNANKHLVNNATHYSTQQLESILKDEIGFSEIVYSTEEPYLGNAYFVAARK